MKKILLIAVFAVCMFIGCNEVKEVPADNTFVITPNITVHPHIDSYWCCVTDNRSGVVYLLYTGNGQGAITPMYNADGTLVTIYHLKESED